jgi:uncharacterized protein YutE (UPF0331/DUF86 family)
MDLSVHHQSAVIEYVKAGVDLIKAAFWPGVAVLGGWKFRAEIRKLLTGLSSLKFAGFEAIFVEGLAATQRKLPPETLAAAKDSERFQDLSELAQIAPIDAVIKAWAKLEDTLVDLAPKLGIRGIGGERPRFGKMVEEFLQTEGLSPQLKSAIAELRSLRNQVVHEPSFTLTPDAATQFVLLALASVEDLKRICE